MSSLAFLMIVMLTGVVGIHIGVGPNPAFNLRDRLIVTAIGAFSGGVLGVFILAVTHLIGALL